MNNRFKRLPLPVTPADRSFMDYLLAGIRRKREEATKPPPPKEAPCKTS